jgi:hypothetical protein
MKKTTATKTAAKKNTTTKAKPTATTKATTKAAAKPATTTSEANTTTKDAPKKEAKPKVEKTKKLSALDAAHKVLATSEQPLNAKELIEAMATKKLWTSPAGKTPHATLYAAILREIKEKGKESRFVMSGPGHFILG